MALNVIITGTTGMVGKGVLLECLEDPDISQVLVINRRPLDMQHHKLQEIIHQNFHDFSPLNKEQLSGYNACFFCLGVSSMGMSEEAYTQITHDITLDFAHLLLPLNPAMTFCYVSGTGTNAEGRSMWARVKGNTENDLQKLAFKAVYLFRPGYIQPLKGIRSRTSWYNWIYLLFKPFYSLLKIVFPKSVTDTKKLGQAMIQVALKGYKEPYLRNSDINALAGEDT